MQDAHQADQLLTIKKEQDVMDQKIIEDMKQKKQARQAMASGKSASHDSVKSSSHEALPEVSPSLPLPLSLSLSNRGVQTKQDVVLSLSLSLSLSLPPSLPISLPPSLPPSRALFVSL